MRDQISIDLWEAYNSIYEVTSTSTPDPKPADKKSGSTPPASTTPPPAEKPATPPAAAVSPNSTPTPTPPAAPRTTLNDPADLDALRKASAQATMAGPSREAQALMSDRTKRMLGPEKLKAGIEGQERVERMKNEIGRPQPKPEASTPASTPAAKTGKGIVLAKKDGISGTLNKATGQFTAGTFDKDQEARYTQRRGAEQLKIDASKVLTKNTNPETRQPQAPSQPTSGLTDADKRRIDDFRALGPLQKLQRKGEMERELANLSPQQRKDVMDYYNRKESVDLFDYLLEYLVAEGYADTNKAALAIMANMSEEWKQSIVEGVRPGEVETPLDKKKYRQRRRSLAGREASADARSRGHVDKFTGKPYGTEEAASRRKDIHSPEKAPEREARRKAEEDPD